MYFYKNKIRKQDLLFKHIYCIAFFTFCQHKSQEIFKITQSNKKADNKHYYYKNEIKSKAEIFTEES